MIEVGDIDDEQAVAYLTANGIPRNISLPLTQLTGGRFTLLDRVLALWPDESVEGVLYTCPHFLILSHFRLNPP